MIAQGAATMFDYIVVAVGIIVLIHLLPRSDGFMVGVSIH